METGRAEHKAACHCGTVQFRVKLTDGLRTARRCTCSFCRMRGALFLFPMRHLHASSAALQSESVWHQCGLP